MSINKLKVQILKSVGSLDQPQSEQVLKFIRQVIESRQGQEDYSNFKKRAMREIQVALQDNRGSQAA